ncbi:hypothetical protein L1889_03790 [Paenalcaligenes niemegkensis]|uniref:hypothetical protein n=1 Tax=Paenalcaligenes niemegkensis TaxID=2895469 RepID=UPI001EE86284|nr:hypothetical protein [Paenalcaligenes niemegkensis]MCQ9615931.1 hypothetical protein [Paenalcaligenes niemegkensis]
MKNLFRDAVTLAGLGCLAAGLYQRCDAGVALIVMGVLMLVPVIVSIKSRGR